MPYDPNQRGFTLIEILVAVMISAIVLLTVYGSLSRTMISKDIAEERAELFSVGRDAVMRMADEIEAALPPLAGDRIPFIGRNEGGRVPRSSIEFVKMNRGGYGMNRVRPGQVYVKYSLDPIAERRGLFSLRRDEYDFAALLAEIDGIETPVDEEEEPVAPKWIPTHLLGCPVLPDDIDIPGSCTRVVGLSFQYYSEVEERFVDEWDTTRDEETEENQDDPRIPAAVQITLYLEDESGNLYPFETIVDLPLGRAQPTPRPEDRDEDEDDEE